MRDSKRKAHISSRRGFTVLEVVIALTVITIVSASAFALIHSHLKLEKQSVQSIEATNIAENAIECFRFANGDAAKFETTYEAVIGEELNAIDGGYEYTDDNGLTVKFEIENRKITITISDNNGEILEEEYTNKI